MECNTPFHQDSTPGLVAGRRDSQGRLGERKPDSEGVGESLTVARFAAEVCCTCTSGEGTGASPVGATRSEATKRLWTEVEGAS